MESTVCHLMLHSQYVSGFLIFLQIRQEKATRKVSSCIRIRKTCDVPSIYGSFYPLRRDPQFGCD